MVLGLHRVKKTPGRRRKNDPHLKQYLDKIYAKVTEDSEQNNPNHPNYTPAWLMGAKTADNDDSSDVLDDDALNTLKEAHRQFEECDKNGNGRLQAEEIEELIEWVLSQFHTKSHNMSQEEINQDDEEIKNYLNIFADANDDGAISFQEFIHWYLLMSRTLQERANSGEHKSLKTVLKEWEESQWKEAEDAAPYTWDFALVFNIGDPTIMVDYRDEEIDMESPSRKESISSNTSRMSKRYSFAKHATNQRDDWMAKMFYVVDRLEKAGMRVVLYKDKMHKESRKVYALVGMYEQNLRKWASAEDLYLQMDWYGGIKHGRQKKWEFAQQTDIPFDDSEEEDEHERKYSHKLWENFYVLYHPKAPQEIYQTYQRDANKYEELEMWNPHYEVIPMSLFTTSVRLKLMDLAIKTHDSHHGFEGAAIPTEYLCHSPDHPLQAIFPIHEPTFLRWFNHHWIRKFSLRAAFRKDASPLQLIGDHGDFYLCKFILHSLYIPVYQIQQYFGEQVAFYFGFMQHIIRWLWIPSGFGVVAFIWQVLNPDHWTLSFVFLMFVIIIWSIFFRAYWRRQENKYRIRFGIVNYQFDRDRQTCKLWQKPGFYKSLFLVGITIFVIMSYTEHFYKVKIDYMKDNPDSWGIGVLTALVFAIMMQIISMAFNFFDNLFWSGNRHDGLYTVKLFVVQMVNNFWSFYFIAYIGPHTNKDKYVNSDGDKLHGNDLNDRVMSDLRTHVAFVFIFTFFIQNFIEVWAFDFYNSFMFHMRKKKMEVEDHKLLQEDEMGGIANRIRKEFYKMEYENSAEDISEVFMIYAYCTWFVAVFPLIPLMAVILLMIEIRIDGEKLCHDCRRPIPVITSGMGLWTNLVDVATQISIFTNVTLVCFRTDAVERIFGGDPSDWTKFYVCIIIVCVAEITWLTIRWTVPDLTEKHLLHLDRQDEAEDLYVIASLNAEDAHSEARVDEGELPEQLFRRSCHSDGMRQSLESIPHWKDADLSTGKGPKESDPLPTSDTSSIIDSDSIFE